MQSQAGNAIPPNSGSCTRYVIKGCLLLCLLLYSTRPTCVAQDLVSRGVMVRELSLKHSVSALALDHDGFLWVGTQSGLFRFDGFEFDPIGDDSVHSPNFKTAPILALLEDKRHSLWISAGTGIRVLTPDRAVTRSMTETDNQNTGFKNATAFFEIGEEIWAFTTTSQIYCFQYSDASTIVLRRTITLPEGDADAGILLANGHILIEISSKEYYYILSPDGRVQNKFKPPVERATFFEDERDHTVYAFSSPVLYTVQAEKNQFDLEYSFLPIFLKPIPTWMAVSNRSPKSLWMGGKLGHCLWYNPENNHYLDLTKLFSSRLYEGRFFSAITGIEDENGGFWLGTTLGLVYVRLPDIQYFNLLPQPQTIVSKQNFSTRGLQRLKDGSLFVGSYAGLFRYFPDGHIKEYLIPNDVLGHPVDPVAYDFLPASNEILIASEGNGMLRYDYATDSIYRFKPSSFYNTESDQEIKLTQFCFSILRDHAGIRWVGTGNGLYYINEQDSIARYPSLEGGGKEIGKVLDLMEDADQTLWLGTKTGLYSVAKDRRAVIQHTSSFLADASIQCLLPWQNHGICIGTRGKGLLFYDPAGESVIGYTTEQGLTDDIISAIQPASDGALWISTNQGLSRFDVEQKQFTNFYIEDGLPDNEFNHGSSMSDPDGTLYFGGVNGIAFFQPQERKFNRGVSRLRVSKIIQHDGKDGINVTQLYNDSKKPEVQLGYRDKYFIVYYAADDPTPYSRENYAYRLVGFHDKWQSNGGKNSIQFTGLQPGHYRLQIKALHQPDEEKNLLEIPVFIATPFFKQWWAYLIYIVVFGGIVFIFLREYFSRLHMHRQLQLELDHKAKLQEINRSKSAFFTNITHEFKTPLTLIQGPAEEIGRISKDPQVNKHANLISKNAKAILSLVNQLLELGKLEANLEQPQFHRLDLVQHINHWLANFQPLAKQKNITLTLESETSSCYVDFDPVKMETVINNLLSNAIKFTPEQGAVACSIKRSKKNAHDEWVTVSVSDTGPGIDGNEQELIFERFYQGKNSVLGGTGIGLALVREMVRLHGGTVNLQSVPGRGATFRVAIPIYQSNNITAHNGLDPGRTLKKEINSQQDLPPEFETDAEKNIILVAEDNEGVASLIREIFEPHFQIIMTTNGKEAREKALETIPDIIITDVMMPIMDGFSLTYLLKQDLHTCHIPVIMLTAKDGETSRIEGRKQGADVYLQKPFSTNELQLTVRNLLQFRANVIQRISKQVTQDAAQTEFNNEIDNSFYKDFLRIIEDNISEPDLSVQDFTIKLGISRTQLHRKLKAITGLSVNQIVRNIRLQKSLSLLRQSGKSVAEVAYQVGFSSPSYFSERFREYYGYPPSETGGPNKNGNA